MKWLLKLLKRDEFAWLFISSLVFCVLLGIRSFGWFQRPELSLYDEFLSLRIDPAVTDERIVVCGMTDGDLVKYGHPLDDGKLALLLEKLAAAKPCVIGLDVYRDLKEPRSGELYPKLESVFRKNDNIIAIERLGKVKAPPALDDKPERVALNNLPRDYAIDDVYRRAYLFLEDGIPEPRPSFALVLAMEYLTAQGVDIQMMDGAGGALLKLGKVVFPRITPDAGCYVGLKTDDYSILADYKVPYGFPGITFEDVMENPPLLEELKGKVVLVATNMDSVKDNNKSPVDATHRGILQHASIINQLLRAGINGEAPLGWWKEWQEILWIGVCVFMGGLLGLFCGSPWRLAPLLAMGLALIALAGWVAFRQGIWIPVVVPGIGFFLASAFVTSFVAYAQSVNLGAMKSIFSQHVSPSVVETLWAERDNFMNGGHIHPQRVTATVFFTDLKNFSTTSEKMEPATLLLWMNEYMNGVVPYVEKHGGMINKFIGDAIMAVFGVPVARTTQEGIARDAVNAVECALAMGGELKRLNADWKLRGLPNTSMRVGINTGELVSGTFGSSSRLEFTVLGDTVNTGARLEGAGKEIRLEDCDPECTILISEATFKLLGDRFQTRLIGPMSLKGKGEKIVVYSILADS